MPGIDPDRPISRACSRNLWSSRGCEFMRSEMLILTEAISQAAFPTFNADLGNRLAFWLGSFKAAADPEFAALRAASRFLEDVFRLWPSLSAQQVCRRGRRGALRLCLSPWSLLL